MNPLDDATRRYRNGSEVSPLEANLLLEEDGTGVDLAEWRRLHAKASMWSGETTIDDEGDYDAEQQAVAGLRLVFEEYDVETLAEYHEFRKQVDFDHPWKEADRTLVENVTPWSGRSGDAVDCSEPSTVIDELFDGDDPFGKVDADRLFGGGGDVDIDGGDDDLGGFDFDGSEPDSAFGEELPLDQEDV